MYTKSKEQEILDCLVDADWARDIVDRISTSGYVIRLFNNTVYWRACKQKSVTKSVTAAEYVALSDAVDEVKFIRCLIEEMFGIVFKESIKMYEDNSGAVAIAKNGNFSKRAKHIEVQYHLVHEYYVKQIIDIIKIGTDDNIADIFTKSLGKQKFYKFRELLKLI